MNILPMCSSAITFASPLDKARELVAKHALLATEELLFSGSHVLNPYHNHIHCLFVVYNAYSCFINSSENLEKVQSSDICLLITAAALHDYGHSGGHLRDDENIQRALDIVDYAFSSYTSPMKSSISQFKSAPEQIKQLIRETEYREGKFTREPSSFISKCIRDADLMMIYNESSRPLLHGLFEEICPQYDLSQDELKKFVAGNREFLTKAKFYTSHAIRMKDSHLERCLKQFEIEAFLP